MEAGKAIWERVGAGIPWPSYLEASFDPSTSLTWIAFGIDGFSSGKGYQNERHLCRYALAKAMHSREIQLIESLWMRVVTLEDTLTRRT